MTIEPWSNSVNKKFFSFSKKPKENATVTEFLSGRTVAYKNNERDLFTYSCNIDLDKESGELEAFWTWFNSSLGGLAGVFSCDAIGSAYYRFTSVPEPQDTDQIRTTLNLNFEEVY